MLYIAQNLKRFRKDKNLTQEEVAEMLGVSPQSVSKWERGDTMPDITLLPALANLYNVSVDTLIGMDKINDRQARNAIFTEGHKYLREGDVNAAIAVFSEALKTFPNDIGLMSDLAMSYALSDGADELNKALSLCERVLADNQGDKVHHTTRAALCFIYQKAGEKEKAVAAARRLPHYRESREVILSHLENNPTMEKINSYIKFIAVGENNQQDFIEIDFATDMVPICTEYNLIEKIQALREEVGAAPTTSGYCILPVIRIRDNAALAPKQIRLRHYAEYLLDKQYDDPSVAAPEIIDTLRKLAHKNMLNRPL